MVHKAWFSIVYKSSFHEQQGVQGLGEGVCSGRQDREGVPCSGDSRNTGESLKGVCVVPCSPVRGSVVPIRLTWRLVKTHYWGPLALAQGVYATGSRVWLEIFNPSKFPDAPGGLGPNFEKHRPGEGGARRGGEGS